MREWTQSRHGDRHPESSGVPDECRAGKEDENKKAVRKAMQLLLIRNRSEQELRGRLLTGGFSEAAAEHAIDYVKSFGYLNDRRYAESYVMENCRKKSRRAMQLQLSGKGISPEIISRAIEEFGQADAGGIMKELLEKRYGEAHLMEEPEKRRAFAFLARKGFSAGEILHSINEYAKA